MIYSTQLENSFFSNIPEYQTFFHFAEFANKFFLIQMTQDFIYVSYEIAQGQEIYMAFIYTNV